MRYRQEMPLTRHAERQQTFLHFRVVGIKKRDGKRIAEYGGRLVKGEAVLA